MNLSDDRGIMPGLDESIFYPEERCRELGLDEEDIKAITEFIRWHMRQRERRFVKRHFIELLKVRRDHLVVIRKLELQKELEQLTKFY